MLGLALTAAGALSACGAGAEAQSNASADCSEAFATMGAVADRMYAAAPDAYSEEDWNSIEMGPLNDCTGFTDWLAGAQENPESVGFTDADAVTLDMLGIRCGVVADAASTPVCASYAELNH